MWRFFALALALRAGAAQDTCPTYAMIDMASWQPPSASEVMADVDVTHCTKLRFKYTTAYDVWLMGSKDAYDKCCFSECGSTQVGSGAQGGTLSEDDDAAFEYEVLADDAGMTLYFSDSKGTHCQDGQKVTVNVLEALVWNRTIGSENPEGGLAVAVDPLDSSIIVAGYTYGDLSMLGEQESAYPRGGSDLFARKLNAVSGKDEWAIQDGTSASDRTTGVSVDGSGSVYMTGYVSDGGALYDTSLGYYDAFVAKYNSEGTFQWGTQCCTAGVDFAHGIAAYGNQSVVIAGESSTGKHRLPGQGSGWGGDFIGFVVSYASDSGAMMWNVSLRTDEDISDDNPNQAARDLVITAVTYDSAGDVLVVGYTEGTVLGLISEGREDAFVVKLDGTSGENLWTTRLGGGSNDRMNAIVTDTDGSVYLAGYTDGALYSPLQKEGDRNADRGAPANSGGQDVIVARLSGSTGDWLWGWQAGSAGDDTCTGIALKDDPFDIVKKIAVVGSTDGVLSGDAGFGGKDVFAILLEATYGREEARTQLGSVEDDEAFAVACEQTNGDFFVTGMSKGDAFGPNEGKEDVFVLRLSGDDLFDSLESPTPAREKKSAVTLTKKQQTMAIIVVCVAVPLLCFLGYLAGKIRTEQKFEALREDHFNNVNLELGQQAAVNLTPRSASRGAVTVAAAPPENGKQPLGQIDTAGRVTPAAMLPAGSLEMTPTPDDRPKGDAFGPGARGGPNAATAF